MTFVLRFCATTILPFKIGINVPRSMLGASFNIDFSEIVMNTGTVKFFDSIKGFGFIQPEAGGNDVFVHISAVERAGMRTIVEGQKLTFDVVRDNRSGKNAADNLLAV